jgi:PAS domain S-box-containing protein
MVFVLDMQGNILKTNEAVSKCLSYKPDELTGKNVLLLHVPERRDEALRIVQWMIAGTINSCTVPVLAKDGTRFEVETKVTRGWWNSQEVLIGVTRDITKRRQAEEALRDSEEKYRGIFKNALIGIFQTAPDGLLINANEAAARMFGYVDPAEICSAGLNVGRDLYANPDDRKVAIDQLQKTGYVEIDEFRVRKRDKSTFWASAAVRAVREPDGTISCFEGSIVDISKRKQAEEALRESEEKFREIFDNANDAITVLRFTPDGLPSHFIEVNKNACLISGYTWEEMLSMSPKDLDDPGEWNEAQGITQKIMERGYLVFERDLIRKDGKKIPIEISTHVFPLNNQNVMLSLFRDITERKRAEEAIRQANRKLKLMSSITRHDINNQLLVLNGYLELLQKKASGAEFEVFFTKITKASSRIFSMIQFTKEYESIGVAAPVWQDTRALVDTAEKEAPLGKVTVNNDLPAGTKVFADPLIVKVFYNLMDNAARYGGKITTIRFSCEERDGSHVIVCEDDGNGIPADEKEKVFDRGFGKNTGLGLALAGEILDITGISIRETGEPGEGSTVRDHGAEGCMAFDRTGHKRGLK